MPLCASLIVIDGSNFYHKVKSLNHRISTSNLDYFKFFINLVSLDNHIGVSINYYVGKINKRNKSKNTLKLYSAQQSFFYELGNQGVTVKPGFMLFSNGKHHEKGVDVKMALDIALGAIKNTYDVVYIVSSDTDLIPAIKVARELGKEVVYIGFESFVSRAMQMNCSKMILINKHMFD